MRKAPVIIPTFCRAEHFKRCVDSLSRCTGASETDLFIGVDYPTKEEYFSGFKEICDYCSTLTGFHKVNVFIRETNLGELENIHDLKKRVRVEGYETYIFTEDDNEFSPNFLEYINQGLDLYRDNKKVMAICGYPHSDSDLALMTDYDKDVYAMQGFCAWGTGYWFDHDSDYSGFPSAKELIYSWKYSFALMRKGMFQTVHRLMYRHKRAGGDLRRRAYCALKDKFCIFPMMPKVRNWGFDGTGLNCAVNSSYSERRLDDRNYFEMEEIEISRNREVDKVYRRCYGMGFGAKVLCVFEYFMFRLTGKTFRDFSSVKNLMRKRAQKKI